MQLAQTTLLVMIGYLAAGAWFALVFVTVGAGQLDPAARGASPGFRLLIFPASVVLWPILAARWWYAVHISQEHAP